MPSSPAPSRTQYLLFSDVHLGADLVQHARPWTAPRLAEELRLDRDLSAMLEYYRAQADPELPWTLIIAGDLCDLMGMSIGPRSDDELSTPLTAEEHTHGLGTADDHAAQKVRAIAERHASVFARLADFVADGHSLVLIRGNHDVEFYWEGPRKAFTEALLSHASPRFHNDAERQAFIDRVGFRHWFYYVENLLYVEHGHQYDEACCYPNVLLPVSPRDPRRLWYSFSDILLRFVVRPTRGLSSEGHEATTMMYYLRLAFSMGVRGCARLGQRFGHAVIELFRNWRDHLSVRAGELAAEHDAHMQPLAERFKLSLDKLQALSALRARPVTGGFFTIMRSVFLDMLAVIGAAAALIVLVAAFQWIPPLYLPLLVVAVGLSIYGWTKGARVFDPRQALCVGAQHVSNLLPTRFVVMGHTHEPRVESLASDATYINLGGWAVDDLDGSPHHGQAPCTHLVIREVDGQPRAELRYWRSGEGPSTFGQTTEGGESGVHSRPAGGDDPAIEAA